MDVEVTELPELRAAAVRTDMQHIGEAWARLNELAGAAGLLGKHDTASIMPVDVVKGAAGEEPWFAAAVLVPEDVELPEGLTEERVPAARYARTVHVGPFEELPNAWQTFTGQSLMLGDYQPGEGVCLEIHKVAPEGTPPSEMRSELYVPLA